MSPSDENQSKASDLVRKLFTFGVGTLFLTEESLRNMIQELRMPKDLMQSLLEAALKGKADFLGKFSNELSQQIFSRLDPKAFVHDILKGYEIKLNMHVRFEPKAGEASAEPPQDEERI
jgi:hypothetical protein